MRAPLFFWDVCYASVGVADHFFWRDHKGREVDCIIEEGGRVRAIEVKAAKTLKPEFFKALNYFCELADLKPSDAMLVNGGDSRRTYRGMQEVPWSGLG